ncbi:hypothetical protein RvY_02101 [Ramazzottius varieornatus]|uniref:Nucleotide-diphospho-sugar transferase domain-containing protein n=1 Tax=Ramazzottius varieornatus TaxID=947166 RepID=A0A1D1UIK0_RAMVA|nr:hypothetical protein RvY_02101 [Ramazzottius varieornatus]
MTVFPESRNSRTGRGDHRKHQLLLRGRRHRLACSLLKYRPSLVVVLAVGCIVCYLVRVRSAKQWVREESERPEDILVHYVWLENRVSAVPYDLKVLQYASIVSAVKRLHPVTIYLHTNAEFAGPYWNAVKNHIKVIPIKRILWANGRRLITIEQEADLFKLKAAKDYGGFLADFDIYFVGQRSQLVQWLKRYDCIFGKTFWKGQTFISSGGFACRPNTDFVREWLHEYEVNFRGYCGKNPIAAMYNACVFPMRLYGANATYRKTIHFADKGMYTYYGDEGAKFRHAHVNNWKRHFYVHNDDDCKCKPYASALRTNLAPKRLVVHAPSTTELTGPLIVHLSQSFAGTQLYLCRQSSETSTAVQRDNMQGLIMTSDMYYIRKPTSSRLEDALSPKTLHLSQKELQDKARLFPLQGDVEVGVMTITDALNLSFTAMRSNPTFLETRRGAPAYRACGKHLPVAYDVTQRIRARVQCRLSLPRPVLSDWMLSLPGRAQEETQYLDTFFVTGEIPSNADLGDFLFIAAATIGMAEASARKGEQPRGTKYIA